MLRVEAGPVEEQRYRMNKEATTHVVLADDHAVVRQGLKRLLNRAPEIEVIGEASDGLEALKSVLELHPDVLLLDIEMPVMDGIEVARRLQEANVKVRILVLSAYDDREYIRALLDLGVSGYLVKGEAPGKIVEAVRGVAQDQKGWVSPQVRKKMEKMNDSATKQVSPSRKEKEILQLLATDRSDASMAEMAGFHNEAEFRDAIQALLQKIGVQSRQEAVNLAIREGWISGAKSH